MSALDFVRGQIARIRQDAQAAATLAEWIGSGKEPVPGGLANSRAMQCIGCPGRHNKFDHRRLEPAIAESIRAQESIRRNVALKTPHDARLLSCLDTAAGKGCGCYLKLKVWVPIENQPDTKMPSYCWVTKERLIQSAKAMPTVAEAVPSKVESRARQTPSARTIVIERNAAIGDVVMATGIATLLYRQGYKVLLRCSESIRPMLQGHPHLTVCTDKTQALVNLNGCYELEPNRKAMHRRDNYLWTARNQLKPHGIMLEGESLPAPVLHVTDKERADATKEFERYPRPWIAVNNRSVAWVNRSVSAKMCAKLSPMLLGTPIWIGTDPAPKNYVAVAPGSIRQLMARISVCDAVVTTDTGPLHIALALKVPTTLIAGPFKQDTFLPPSGTDGVLWNAVSVSLPCIGCCDYVCQINKDKPPCTEVEPKAVADAVKRLIEYSESQPTVLISVVIPVYKPAPRLKRCIAALPPGVEIIVAMDGNADAVSIPGVTVVPSTGKRTGFGATCNRGATVASGKHILFLNDDCYLDLGAIDAIVSVMDGDVAVVGCLTRYPDGKIYHGGTHRTKGGYGHLDWGKKEPTIRSTQEMEFVNFAAALVRKSAFDSVGGFDPEYDTYCEDSDLCLRLRRDGWKVMYQPAATGIHDEAQSTGAQKGELHAAAQAVFQRRWKKYFDSNQLGILGRFDYGT